MKDKLKSFFEKSWEVIKKVAKGLNKKAVVACAAVLILAGAVLLNFLLLPPTGEKEKEGLDVAIDLSDVSAAVKDKESAEATGKDESKNDAFAQMTLSRRQARDEALEVLTGVAESSTAIDSMKQEALGELQAIAVDIENEANIESLVMAKGFEECVAVVNGDTASVIVKTDGLLDTEVAQISAIVYEQTGIHPDNLNIIEAE
ncbi:MAG: SpoIIIAH-like family protein [Ruminococcaceae bacterium]|nr:SpoIIIAH-like family protein [Oscillospiraceae bacterium]